MEMEAVYCQTTVLVLEVAGPSSQKVYSERQVTMELCQRLLFRTHASEPDGRKTADKCSW